MGRLVQGRLGKVTFTPVISGSANVIPVYSWGIQARRNRVTGDPVGNTWSTNYADGMLTSRFVAQIMCRKTTGECWSSGFIDKFITRLMLDTAGAVDANSGLDDTEQFTIAASDGAALATLTNAKPESFVLTISKGSPVGLSVVFVSPQEPTITNDRAASTTAAYDQTVDNTKLLQFDAATFKYAANLAGLGSGTPIEDFYGAEIAWSNNHIVNAPLDGTLNALSFDAGIMRCGATFTVKAHHGLSGDLPPFTTDSALRIQLGLGSSDVIKFDLASVVPETDLDSGANPGASYRTWQCNVLGVGGGSPSAPITISR